MHLALPSGQPKRLCGRRRRLACFIAGSLLLHVLVVALWRGEPPAAPEGQGTFQITLVARHGDAAEAASTERPRPQRREPDPVKVSDAVSGLQPAAVEDSGQPALAATAPAAALPLAAHSAFKAQHSLTRSRESADEPADRAAPKETPMAASEFAAAESVATSGSTSHGQHALSTEARHRRVRAELLRALLPHFDYPQVARRRGWQGRVRIGLLVEADGDLSGVHLVESSGHRVLDRAAMKNVNQLRNVPSATQWLDGRDMDLVLPVSYRLKDR